MVIIIDGNHLASRAYYALGELTTSNGKHVNCIYGFVNSFRKLYKRFKNKNTYILFTWDGPGRKRGHDLDSNYKANRSRTKDNFREQLEDLRNFVSIIGVKQYRRNNIEADDLIGTLTIKARKNGHKVKIISADHDFEQLVTKHVEVINPAMGFHKEIIKDVQYVIDKYGLKPNQISELLALTGDSSDNITGVEKCGDVIASRLLLANGSLENICNNVEDLKIYNRKGVLVDATKNQKNKVRESIDKIKINKQIVTIDCNVDLDFVLEHKKPDFEQLHEMFEKFEFKKYLSIFEKWKSDFLV